MMTRSSDPGYPARDEVDLLALLQVLIRGWYVLLAAALTGLVAGMLITFLLPRTWTSHAVVVLPGTEELRGLSQTAAQMRVAGLTPSVDGDWLWAQFQQTFSARSAQEAFILTDGGGNGTLAGLTVRERQKRVASIADGITLAENGGQKQNPLPYAWLKLSAKGDTPDAARMLLTNWLHTSAARVAEQARDALASQRDSALDVAEGHLTMMTQQEADRRAVQINRLEYALSLARAAGIQQPLWTKGYTLSDDPDFPVSLGASGLAEKLALLKRDTDPGWLSTPLREQQLKVRTLRALRTEGVRVQPYRLLASPSLPLSPDGPSRSLVVLLTVLLCLIGAAGIVLLRDALSVRRAVTDSPSEVRALMEMKE